MGVTRWVHHLLDRNDQPIDILDGVTGGRVEVVARSVLGGSGDITIDDRGQGIDWMNHRVQSVFHPGDDDPWPVGTFLFAKPVEGHTRFGRSWSVGLLPKTKILNEDKVTAPTSYAVGTPIIPTVVGIIHSTGETRVAVTDSDAALTAAVTFDVGTSKLEIVNTLLQAAGFWSLWCDGSGQFRVQPYENPSDRPVAFTFQHGETSVHMPEWSREQNLIDVPNVFMAVAKTDNDDPPLIGVARNQNPDSPFSFQNRGVWIAADPDTGVEASSQAVIDQYAARRLRELMDPVARITVTHKPLPLEPDQLVEFIPADGVVRRATVQRMSMRFTFDTDVDAEWREA